MSDDDRAAQLLRDLRTVLGPFGWTVDLISFGCGRDWSHYCYRFCNRVKIRSCNDEGFERWDETVLGCEFTLTGEVMRHGRDGFLKNLHKRWAADVMRKSFDLLDPELPPAPEVDWRPTETIPEDYYAR